MEAAYRKGPGNQFSCTNISIYCDFYLQICMCCKMFNHYINIEGSGPWLDSLIVLYLHDTAVSSLVWISLDFLMRILKCYCSPTIPYIDAYCFAVSFLALGSILWTSRKPLNGILQGCHWTRPQWELDERSPVTRAGGRELMCAVSCRR